MVLLTQSIVDKYRNTIEQMCSAENGHWFCIPLQNNLVHCVSYICYKEKK